MRKPPAVVGLNSIAAAEHNQMFININISYFYVTTGYTLI